MVAITLGCGRRKPQGQLAELSDTDLIDSLGRTLVLHAGTETWWSGATFTGNYRSDDRWLCQQVIGLDIDHYDTLGQHAPLSEEAAQVLRETLPQAPCTWTHMTPRGARLIVLLDKPIIDQLMYPLAWQALCTRIAPWVPKLPVGSLRIDETCKDLSRFFWAPRATVAGIARGVA